MTNERRLGGPEEARAHHASLSGNGPRLALLGGRNYDRAEEGRPGVNRSATLHEHREA
jgi:hypothetical protein